MIQEIFLACALALPLVNDPGGHHNPNTYHDFVKEYDWLKELLERHYPNNEFLIIPVEYENTPPDWLWVPFGWRGHLIYRKPIRSST